MYILLGNFLLGLGRSIHCLNCSWIIFVSLLVHLERPSDIQRNKHNQSSHNLTSQIHLISLNILPPPPTRDTNLRIEWIKDNYVVVIFTWIKMFEHPIMVHHTQLVLLQPIDQQWACRYPFSSSLLLKF